jgi:hypothetical protein
MKAKIAFFRGIVAPLAPQKGRVTHVTHSCQAEQRLAAPTFERPRPNLKIIWRTNPANRRLECHWAVEGDAAADEGVSCGRVFRRAA